jgi:hypothetical protein
VKGPIRKRGTQQRRAPMELGLSFGSGAPEGRDWGWLAACGMARQGTWKARLGVGVGVGVGVGGESWC